MGNAEQQQIKELEKKTSLLEKQLKESQNELVSFNYSISHDLKSPLRNIFGFAQLLNKKYRERLQGQGVEYLDMILSGVERMGRLIDDLLNLSRISRAEMSQETLDLSAIATSIMTQLQESQPERQARVIIQPGINVIGDPELMQVALKQLLDNAWKFTSNNELTVVEFGVKQQGDIISYFVRDNGAGFAMDQLYRLFTPFQRLHLESEYPGTGIGLAIVRKIIQRHGGEVSAEGAEGEGATFSFTVDQDRA